MKKLSSTLLLLLSAFFILFSAESAHANRAAAGEIAYKWISDSTYLLTYTVYRDCGGTAEPSTVNVCYYNTCNTDRGNVSLSKKTPLSSNGTIVQSACAGTSTTMCSAPAATLKGFRKWVYEATVSLPSKCASWHFVVAISSRNAGISNYTVPAASDRMFTEATLNNIDAPTSSSPTFNQDLIQYMCAGFKQSFNYGGTDADGDDLTYTLIDPASAADNQTSCTFPPAPTSYVFGGPGSGSSLATNPFRTGGSFNLNPATGSMTFTPDVIVGAQQPLLTVLITKRRGTKVVGTVMRDMEFIISTGCVSANANFTLNSAASTGILYTAPNNAQVCPNAAHRICFSINSIDPSVTISNVTDNHLTFSPTSGTSTITPTGYAGVGTNNVTACFDWTPNEKDEGMKYLIIKSEVCKPGTPKIYRIDSINIDIVRTAKAVASDTFICFGDTSFLCGTPNTPVGATPYTYAWGSTVSNTGLFGSTLGIVTANDSCTKVAPASTTTYLFETSGIPAVCKRVDLPALNTNQAEVKVVVVNPKIDAGPDTVMCSYSQLQMNANLLNPQPELTYQYRWSPGKWLNDSTSPTPILKFALGTPVTDIPDSITFYLTCTPFPSPECKKSDTMKVHILKGFYILTGDTLAGVTGLGFQGRQKGFSDTAICLGKSIAIIGWGDPRYNYVWNPSTGVSTPSDFKSGMTITPTQTTKYSLTAARAGCPDSTKDVNIIVDPIPNADIGDDKTICFGDTLNLYAVITPYDPEQFPLKYPGRNYTYSWFPGGALARADTFFTYFTGYRTEKIFFTVKTPAGCTGIDSAVYTVQPRFFITTGNDTAICPGDTAQLSVAGDNLLKTITWRPLTDIDSLHSLHPKVAPYFTTNYVVVGVDSNQCVDSGVVTVTVFPRAVLYLQDSALIYPGDVFKMNPQGNVLFYKWFPLNGFTDLADSVSSTPKVSPLMNTTYVVKGVTDAGCTVQDSIFVVVAPDSHIDVPNAFTPGRGGENNIFKPVHLGKATLKSFSIYNRWGVKMFESNDIDQGWDGSFGGQPQPMGVYVYVLEATTAAGRTITKQGNVTLIR